VIVTRTPCPGWRCSANWTAWRGSWRRCYRNPVTAPGPDTSEAPGNLLAPEPAVRTGALIGYARVSTPGQLLDRQ